MNPDMLHCINLLKKKGILSCVCFKLETPCNICRKEDQLAGIVHLCVSDVTVTRNKTVKKKTW